MGHTEVTKTNWEPIAPAIVALVSFPDLETRHLALEFLIRSQPTSDQWLVTERYIHRYLSDAKANEYARARAVQTTVVVPLRSVRARIESIASNGEHPRHDYRQQRLGETWVFPFRTNPRAISKDFSGSIS